MNDPVGRRARKAMRRLAVLTGKLCATCDKSETRCCSYEFCEIVAEGLDKVGVLIKPTGHPTVPYLGEEGCVVPPHLRPGCTGFVCLEKLTHEVKRERRKLIERSKEDEVQELLWDHTSSTATARLPELARRLAE